MTITDDLSEYFDQFIICDQQFKTFTTTDYSEVKIIYYGINY